jgi:hypothetical protein
MSAAEIDQARAHRWFAVEFNNTGWSLLESGDRSPAVVDRALACAYAAWLHWDAVGTAIHRQRALNLLAQACTAAGLVNQAIRYGREGLALSQANGDEQTAFDRAAALASLAAALHGSADRSEATALTEQALAHAADLPDDDQGVIRLMLALRPVALSDSAAEN